MRWTTLALAALTGIAAGALASPAGAFTPNTSAGLRPAAESIDPVASVHCRSFKHRSFNHPWGFGCGRGADIGVGVHRRGFVEEREGRRGRVGIHEREGGRVSVRERSSTRSETDVRSRESTRARGEVRSGSTRSSTTGRSGTTGNRSSTGGGGTTGHSSGGGGTSGQSS